MQFLGNFGKIVRWRSPPPGELAPPPQGNPRFATAYSWNAGGTHHTGMLCCYQKVMVEKNAECSVLKSAGFGFEFLLRQMGFVRFIQLN